MADLGKGPGGPVSPPPPLSLGKKKRKAGRASDEKKNLPLPHLAQGLDSPLIQNSLGLFHFVL